MKFYSLRQYFYKLYTWMFGLMLVPLLVFIISYQVPRLTMVQSIEVTGYPLSGEYGFVFIGLSAWLFAYWIYASRIVALKNLPGLADRLERYATLALVRTTWLVVGMLVLAAGHFVTQARWFTIVFMASLCIPVVLWPVPSRVCRDLQLKGDEEKVVLLKMDLS